MPAALAVAAVVVVLALASCQSASSPSSGSSSASGSPALVSQRIAATSTACRQWLSSYASAASPTPTPGWCDGFAGWMSGQVASGHMTGTTTWNNPQSMLSACRQWATSAGGSGGTGTTGSAWCDQMVTWMSQYMGRWGDWQDWDHHMGGWNSQSPSPGGSQALQSQRIDAMWTACRQWLTSDTGARSAAPSSTWCAGFAGWMSGQVAFGHMTGTTT